MGKANKTFMHKCVRSGLSFSWYWNNFPSKQDKVEETLTNHRHFYSSTTAYIHFLYTPETPHETSDRHPWDTPKIVVADNSWNGTVGIPKGLLFKQTEYTKVNEWNLLHGDKKNEYFPHIVRVLENRVCDLYFCKIVMRKYKLRRHGRSYAFFFEFSEKYYRIPKGEKSGPNIVHPTPWFPVDQSTD